MILNKILKGEFSKKLAIWILSIFALFCFAGLGVIAFIQPDVGGSIVGIIGVVMPVPVAVVAKYYDKAKAENLLKIENSTTNDSTNSPI
jgi:predicted neutral ceramidase superfamily lipid hydrolase